jgi:2-iminobutanoate/2-iminopropanoate deaminase
MTEVRTLNSSEVIDPVGPYSHAVVAGGLLFCTGQLPLDREGTMVEGGAAAEASKCLENLERVCSAAGTSLQNAVRIGVYMTDLGQFTALNEVYAEALPHRPARTTIEVSALPLGAAVEIDAVVALS